MLLREAIARVDKSKGNQQDIDVYNLQKLLQSEFDITMSLDYTNKTNTRVTCYWLAYWYCTDTWVGSRVYFLDDKLLAVSYQPSRKASETFTFANKEIKKEFKEYILSLAEVVEDEDDEEPDLNLDDDIENGIYVHYATQLLATHVYYEDQLCKIIYPKGTHKNGKEFKKMYTFNFGSDNRELINIELSDESQITVDLRDCIVPYNIV